MSQEQIDALIRALSGISSSLSKRDYTITGAADWPILLILGGLILSLVAFMWRDLRTVWNDSRTDWREKILEHKIENDKNFDLIWAAHRDCQNDCCPRLKRHDERKDA